MKHNIEIEYLTLSSIFKYIGIMVLIILIAAGSAFIGSLTYMFVGIESASYYASLIAGGVLYYLVKLFGISYTKPNEIINEMDLGEHPAFGVSEYHNVRTPIKFW